MDKPNYAFMKTGFNQTEQGLTEEDRKNIVSLVSLFGENALRTAIIYVKHSKRDGVTIEDVKRGVMLEAFFFMKRPDLVEKIEEIKEKLFQGEDDEDDGESEDDESENDSIIVDDDDVEDFKDSECSCALCSCLNKIYERWDAWDPATPFEKVLKDNIGVFGVTPGQ